MLRNPFCRWMCGHIDPDKPSPRQPSNDQDVERVEADVRHYEQIHITNSDRLFFIQLYRWFPSVLKVMTIMRREIVIWRPR
jgi:hypothetical protein